MAKIIHNTAFAETVEKAMTNKCDRCGKNDITYSSEEGLYCDECYRDLGLY